MLRRRCAEAVAVYASPSPKHTDTWWSTPGNRNKLNMTHICEFIPIIHTQLGKLDIIYLFWIHQKPGDLRLSPGNRERLLLTVLWVLFLGI